jgi:hypothetical protein
MVMFGSADDCLLRSMRLALVWWPVDADAGRGQNAAAGEMGIDVKTRFALRRLDKCAVDDEDCECALAHCPHRPCGFRRF